MEQVSWDEAVEFCRRLTQLQQEAGVMPEGWAWRLPTEAEWGYASSDVISPPAAGCLPDRRR